LSGQRGNTAELIEVVAGVLRDDGGRVLLAQRPPGKHLAGTWEFPGGKREPGESGAEALGRELEEELGIAVQACRPWLSLTHHYPELAVRLRLFTVQSWRGEPGGREGQPLRWVEIPAMADLPMPAADRPIVRAFSIDDRYAITPDPAELGGNAGLLAWTRDCLDRGIRLLQLRAKSLDEAALRELGRNFGALAAEYGARWLLNGSPDLAEALAADGVHLDGKRLERCLDRPLAGDSLVAASCHGPEQLARAGRLGLDFVTVSPVQPTTSHPGAGTLGWQGFERLCRVSPLPVFALGGVGPEDLDRAREQGGFGVAGIRAFGGR
jgi:8-oxo-dGTP diphosphatase